MFVYFRAPLSWRELARRTYADTLADDCPGLAAQLAFYFFLALFPALLFLVSLAGYLPVDAALTAPLDRVQPMLPQELVAFLRSQIESAAGGQQGGLLTLGVLGAIWSSSSALTAIISALNRAYDIEEWRPWWKRRLIAIILTVLLAVFVVSAFAFIVGGGDIATWLAGRFGWSAEVARAWSLVQWPIAGALVVIAVDLVYYFAPNAETPFVWITPGALLATVLWVAASLGFRIYVQNFTDYSALHGSIGAVIVLLLWLYLSGFALLIGAELNAEIDKSLHPRQPQPLGHPKKIGPAADRP